MASLRSPDFNPGFVERCLVEVIIAGAEFALVVNKYDLVTESDPESEQFLSYYEKCGFSVFRESILRGISEELAKRVAAGTWLLLGQSGTGKSTLMNRLLGADRQAVGEISQIEKGRHTTTNPVLHLSPRQAQLALIDVPGLREFGLKHRDVQEIRNGYPDFLQYACRFENCLHLNEPGCAVKNAVAKSELPEFRYRYYSAIIDALNEDYKPRKGDYWRGVRK
jgi:ribosome biogenesis GTPase